MATKFIVEIEVDESKLLEIAGNGIVGADENILDLVQSELGWVEQSGISVLNIIPKK